MPKAPESQPVAKREETPHKLNKTAMQVQNHKALDRRDQSFKTLTPHTYYKRNIERKETTWERENERQPLRNQRLNLRPEITFQAHIAYTNENIIQT